MAIFRFMPLRERHELGLSSDRDPTMRNPRGRRAAARTTTAAKPVTTAALEKAGSLGALQSRQSGGLARNTATAAAIRLATTVSTDLITSHVHPTRRNRRRFPTNTMSAPTMAAADPRSAIA